MKFRDEFPVGAQVSFVKRNRFLKDTIWGNDADPVVISPIDGLIDERYIWCKDGNSIVYADANSGAILGYPNVFLTRADQEELRDNILARIFDFFVIMIAGSLEAEDSNRGSCV